MPATEKRAAGLTIIVQEHEHTVLNADNTISRFDPRGTVTIGNTSRVNAIWDAELEVIVHDYHELNALVDGLRKEFPEVIRNYESVIISHENWLPGVR